MNFDQVLQGVRNGEEFYVPVSAMGMGVENLKGGKVSKAGVFDFLNVAKRRFRKQNPIAPNQADYVNWILYDRISYAAAATVPNLSKLFVAPIGTNSKTKVDTNLELVSQLPAPQWFNCTGFSIYFEPNVAPVDLAAYLHSEYMEFWVSSKVYLEGPMDQFPSSGGVQQSVALGTMTAAATSYSSNSVNGWPSAHNQYDVRLPAGLGLGKDGNGNNVVADGILGITILQSQTFHVELKADAGGATLAAANAVPINGTGITVAVRLHGILSRGVQ